MEQTVSAFFSGFNWTSLGIDAGIIVAIVGLVEGLKRKAFKKACVKSKWLPILFTCLLACLAAAAKTEPMRLQPLAGNILRYAGISTLVYVFSKPLLKKVGLKE
jgi:hypothetical protein